MDKLRALVYFVQVADSGSFSAAARVLKVTNAAITKSIAALEQELGTTLLRRTVRGVSLTTDGQRYREVAQKLIGELDAVEQRIRPRDEKPRGALRVGMRSVIAEQCVLPRIGRFLATYPDVEVFPQRITTFADVNSDELDVAVLIGWPTQPDLIVVHLAQTRHIICASPGYWARAGKPQEPEQLQDHQCLSIMSGSGVLLDRWTFERASELRSVTVKGPFSSGDRTWVEEAACGGAGVVRIADIGVSASLASGLLVPVLIDWTATEAPTIFAGYWRRGRKSNLVQVFLDFLHEVFDEIQADIPELAAKSAAPVPKPAWYGRVQGKLSQQPATAASTVRSPDKATAP